MRSTVTRAGIYFRGKSAIPESCRANCTATRRNGRNPNPLAAATIAIGVRRYYFYEKKKWGLFHGSSHLNIISRCELVLYTEDRYKRALFLIILPANGTFFVLLFCII